MLEMFLFCTGSLDGVLVITDAGKGKTGVFFFFKGVIFTHSFQHDVDSEMFFSCPWEMSYIVFLYLVWSSENLRLS